MVFLHQQGGSSRKRHSSFNSPFPEPKIQKSTINATAGTTETETPPPQSQPQPSGGCETLAMEKMVSILAQAGCTLINLAGPPCLPSDDHKFRSHLHRIFTTRAAHQSEFLAGFAVHIQSPQNLRRVLTSSSPDGYFTPSCNSLVRHLLLVPSIQLDIQNMLLEKIPEYFQVNPGALEPSIPLRDDVPRLIINHFRWLDFIVDCNAFNDKLLQVLSICPLQLKKEIIGSLPEIVGDQNNKTVVDSLEQMLQEDSSVIVPVLDSLSNLHLDDELKEQVITIALSCIRTIDGEHMPYLLRFLVLSATPANSRRIISKIREQLKFIGVSSHYASQDKNKLKGKSLLDSTDATVLDTLRSGLRFKSILCQEMLKEFSCLHKPQDHRVIDIWLLVLIYANGDNAKRSIEKIFKKKINDGCIQEVLIDQCIRGHADLVQSNFPSFLALSEYLLACKEQRAREFGIHMYTCLFEELVDTYSRQEVLGALVTHVGSGVSFEVTSALETLKLLVSKYAQDLIPLSSHINGILDYLEGFSFENLNKVYDVFSQLSLSASCCVNSFRSSIANELVMIVRKQLNHPDMTYKKMGLIGTLKIVSCIGNVNITCAEQTQKSNCGEALELLETSLESCKHLASPLTFLYDEMAFMLDQKSLHPAFMEWINKRAGEFEFTFLSDLEGGQLPSRNSDCGLEGELWMNLDGNISPVCLNILPLVVSSNQSSLLQILPANFQLFSEIEKSTNQGSLGGIDALLGCPLHMPSSKYFSKDAWQSLTGKQKQIVCFSLYYAANWIRELLNAFCSQVAGKFECTSQATKEHLISKLLKRLRNLVFLETILNKSLESCPLSLPELHHQFELFGPSHSRQGYALGYHDKSALKRVSNRASPKLKKNKRIAKSQTDSYTDGKLRQLTILDVLKKAGALTNQEEANDSSSTMSSKSTSHLADQHSDYDESLSVKVSAATKILDLQRFKFRPLLLHCYSIMTFSKIQNTCCSDPMAELPLYLYLLRDLQYKLDCFTILGRKCDPSDISGTKLGDLLQEVRPLFSTLKKHFDNAMILLREGDNGCQGHWEAQSCSSGNPNFSNVFHSKTSPASSFIEEVLHFLTKILDHPDIQMDKIVLLDVLSAFQPTKALDLDFPGMQPCPVPGSIEYLYCGAYSFLEDVLDTACSFSFMVASESLLALETLVRLAQKCNQKNGRSMKLEFSEGLLINLHGRLGIAAEKFMKHNWDAKNIENGWKRQVERVQKILRIYLENSECTSTLLNQIACSILPEVSLYQTAAEEDAHHGFTTLCPATYLTWYRVLHEVNLAILHTLVKEALGKPGTVMHDKAKELLTELLKSVNVVVSLVNMSRTHDKVTLHSMAVKYGGKFIDSFMKVFDFLQAQIQVHNELVIQTVKELQKATRTLQTLCSEAKGSKQTAITSKVPATKRSLERFLFRVKALVHATSSGCTFWMGNLKHKDLAGQIVSSQAYIGEHSEHHDTCSGEAGGGDDDDDEHPIAIQSEDDRETE